MYKITIKNLNLFGYHGVKESEKENGQNFRFNVEIVMDSKTTFGNVTAQLADMSGKTILNFNLANNSGLQAKKLDISFLPQGVYYIKINADGEIITKKIVKQ